MVKKLKFNNLYNFIQIVYAKTIFGNYLAFKHLIY